jgi:hypothetical protein
MGGHVKYLEDMNEYNIFVRKSAGKRMLGSCRYR